MKAAKKRFTSYFLPLMTVRMPRLVIRKDVFLHLAVQKVDVVIILVDWLYGVSASPSFVRATSTTKPITNLV